MLTEMEAQALKWQKLFITDKLKKSFSKSNVFNNKVNREQES